MATKMCFIINDNEIYQEKIIDFQYVKGLAFSQKQKNVLSFHDSIKKIYPNHNILEVSTKSFDDVGRKCSAFNLKIDGKFFESVFQSSKVFNGNIQYKFIEDYLPRDAKKYIAENATNLIGFNYNNILFPLSPRSLFYDYLYITSLISNNIDVTELLKYSIFTDIEFNEKKQINCQARSLAIFVSLSKKGLLNEAMLSINNFIEIVYFNKDIKPIQLRLI